MIQRTLRCSLMDILQYGSSWARLSDIPLPRDLFTRAFSTDSDTEQTQLTRQPDWLLPRLYHPQPGLDVHRRLYRRRSVRHDDAKRDSFQRMVQDAKDDKFDLILTKSTRFAHQHARQHPLHARRTAFRRRRRFFLPERQHQHLRRGLRAAPDHHVRHCAG